MRYLAAFLLAFSISANAADVILEWNAPTTREDGSPLPASEIASYRLYCGTVSGGPYAQIGSVAGNVTQTTVQSCAPTGKVYFVSAAVDTQGVVSPYSNEATVTLLASAPKAPMAACPVQPKIYIVSSISGRTDRPLYNDQFIQIGRVEFLLPDGSPRVCETLPIVRKTGSSTDYRYTTNNAGLHGLTICKEWKP